MHLRHEPSLWSRFDGDAPIAKLVLRGCQTEHMHPGLVSAPIPASAQVGEAEVQAKCPCSKRAGVRGGSRQLEMAQEATDDRSVGDSGDEPQGTLVTTRTALQVDGQDALEQTGPAPSRRDRAGGSIPPAGEALA
jgi:hypothetical protein